MARRLRLLLVGALALAFGPLSLPGTASELYQVTNLGNLQVYGLDSSGQVLAVNTATSSSPQSTPFVYNSYGPSGGQEIRIPMVGATAMSANGTVSGGLAPDGPGQAAVYNVNTPNVPPTLVPTSLPGALTETGLNTSGVNDSGQVVGSAATPSANGSGVQGPSHAFLATGSTITNLGTLGGPESWAKAVNNAGQVVGSSFISGTPMSGSFPNYSSPSTIAHAFLYTAGRMIDLGGLPGYTYSMPTAINASGQVVGFSQNFTNATVSLPFLYSNGHMTNLGTLPGDYSAAALGINSQGTVIGSSRGISGDHAFTYENGVMTNLQSLIPSTADIHVLSAAYINDAGQILAQGVDASGASNVYLLTPSTMPAPVAPPAPVLPEPSGNEVPEPSTLVFASVLAVLAGAKGIPRGHEQMISLPVSPALGIANLAQLSNVRPSRVSMAWRMRAGTGWDLLAW